MMTVSSVFESKDNGSITQTVILKKEDGTVAHSVLLDITDNNKESYIKDNEKLVLNQYQSYKQPLSSGQRKKVIDAFSSYSLVRNINTITTPTPQFNKAVAA